MESCKECWQTLYQTSLTFDRSCTREESGVALVRAIPTVFGALTGRLAPTLLGVLTGLDPAEAVGLEGVVDEAVGFKGVEDGLFDAFGVLGVEMTEALDEIERGDTGFEPMSVSDVCDAVRFLGCERRSTLSFIRPLSS